MTSAVSEDPFRVLVIDDNHDAANVLSLVLRKRGINARAIYGGADALSAAHEFQPDCIVSDIGMPGVDGYEVARRFRADPRFVQTPLIALTAYTNAEKTAAAGFDFHVVKAGSLSSLLSLIEQTKVLRTRLGNMEVVSDGQGRALVEVKELIRAVTDGVQDLKTELTEEVQELKQELREVKEEMKEMKEDLNLIQGQDE